MDNSPKSYKPEGLVGSLVIHGILIALFFLFVLKTPDPPLELGGSGIELNYGTVPEGYGDNQTLEPSGDQNEPLPAPQDQEIEPLSEPSPEPATPTPPATEEVITSNTDDATPVEPKVNKEPKPAEELKKTTETSKQEKKVEKPLPTESSKKEVATSTPSSNAPSTASNGGNNNNGDRPGKTGDQGNPGGSVDAKALYGNLGEGGAGPGGAGGNKLDLTGWRLDFKLDKKDLTSENGKIVFQIKVDDKGDLVSIIPIEKTVSPAVVKFYQDEIVENWAVDRTRENVNPPPLATGKYTVFVRSK